MELIGSGDHGFSEGVHFLGALTSEEVDEFF